MTTKSICSFWGFGGKHQEVSAESDGDLTQEQWVSDTFVWMGWLKQVWGFSHLYQIQMFLLLEERSEQD